MNYESWPIFTMWSAQTLELSIIMRGIDVVPVLF